MRILDAVEFYWPRIDAAEVIVREVSERLAGGGRA
jgi:hypothetical protein